MTSQCDKCNLTDSLPWPRPDEPARLYHFADGAHALVSDSLTEADIERLFAGRKADLARRVEVDATIIDAQAAEWLRS